MTPRQTAATLKFMLGFLAVASILAVMMLTGCATVKPCPPPPEPIIVRVPVIQPSEPPPPLETPRCRLCELPDDATFQQALIAVSLDYAEEREARKLRDRILDIYRQRAGVPMLTTAAPLPSP